jgi:hypothetical protein
MTKFRFKIVFHILKCSVIFISVPFDLRNKYSLFCRLAGLGLNINIPYLYIGFPSENFPVEIYFNSSFGNL